MFQIEYLSSNWGSLCSTLKLLLRSNRRLSLRASSISQDSSDLNNTNASKEEVDGCQAIEVSVYRKVTDGWECQAWILGWTIGRYEV